MSPRAYGFKRRQRLIDNRTQGAKLSSNTHQFFETRFEKEWLSTKEAAQYLSTTPNAIRIMACRGLIQKYKIKGVRESKFRFEDCRSLFQKKGT